MFSEDFSLKFHWNSSLSPCFAGKRDEQLEQRQVSTNPIKAWLSYFAVIEAFLLMLSVQQAKGDEDWATLITILHHDCGSCHGYSLKGGLGPALTKEALAAHDNAALVETILNGRPGTAMPGWAALLSREKVENLVYLLRVNQL